MSGEGHVWKESFFGRPHGLARRAPRVRTGIGFAAGDLVIVWLAYTFALAFPMSDPMGGDARQSWADLAVVLPVIVMTHLAANIVAGTYDHVWEHASAYEATQVLSAHAIAGTVVLGLGWYVGVAVGMVVPYPDLFLGASLTLGGMGLVRLRTRLFSVRGRSQRAGVLVVGKGRESATFAQAPTVRAKMEVVGSLSDAPPNDNWMRQPAQGELRPRGPKALGAIVALSAAVRGGIFVEGR